MFPKPVLLARATTLNKESRKAKIPNFQLIKLKTQIDELRDEIKKLNDVPTLNKAEKLALIKASSFMKENYNGLYRGELLNILGTWYLEFKNDAKEAKEYFSESKEWFIKAVENDKLLNNYPVPGKTLQVSSPPPAMRSKDVWGNAGWGLPKAGEVFNRKTSQWYVSYYRLISGVKLALTCFILGDKKTALN